MAGVFTIRPYDKGAFVCTMMQDASNTLQVIPTSIEMNYHQRVNMIYAESQMGGRVSGINTGLVPIKFTVMVKGGSQSDAISELRLLTQAIVHKDGGYLEYRPIGLATNVMTTWYKYVQSKIPRVVRSEGLIDKVMETYEQAGSSVDAVIVEVELQTFAWGTSDPYDLRDIATGTVNTHYDGASNDNTLYIAGAFKGDVVFPVVAIEGGNVGGGLGDVTELYLHRRDQSDGTTYHYDWFQGEDFTFNTGWASQSDPTYASGGSVARYTDAGSEAEMYYDSIANLERYALGRVAAVANIRTSASDSAYARIAYDAGAFGNRNVTQRLLLDHSAGNLYKVHDFDHVSAPMVPVPERMGEGTNPSVATFGANIGPVVLAEGVNTGDQLDVDWIWLPKIGGRNYFAKFLSDSNNATIDDAQTSSLIIDCIEGQTYGINSSNELVGTWTHHGPSLNEFLLHDGINCCLRLTGQSASGVELTFEFDIDFDGIYGTIYPFETAL
jgi:hypothetical protein